MHPHVPGRRARVRRSFGLALGLAALVSIRAAQACDICAVYTATELGEGRTGPRAGVAVQYTHFGTLQNGGEEVPNPAGEYIDSVITQIVFGYQVTPRVGVQLNLPIINRDYRRLEGGRPVSGNVFGPGDLSLVAHALVHSVVTENALFRFSVLGGLKLPSGDPSRLAEELAEPAGAGARLVPRHSDPGPGDPGGGGAHHEASGVHGHDLALGSGSVDGLVGGEIFWSYRRGFVTGRLQYAIRTEGAFDYRYANDLTWDGGPGAYVLLEHDYTLALQASLAGETKGKDTQQGQRLDDTAITNLFMGPRVLATWGTSLSGEATVEFPVIQNNTALQIVGDYRVRGALVWRF